MIANHGCFGLGDTAKLHVYKAEITWVCEGLAGYFLVFLIPLYVINILYCKAFNVWGRPQRVHLWPDLDFTRLWLVAWEKIPPRSEHYHVGMWIALVTIKATTFPLTIFTSSVSLPGSLSIMYWCCPDSLVSDPVNQLQGSFSTNRLIQFYCHWGYFALTKQNLPDPAL